VVATWKRDRCVRAETGMIAHNMQRTELDQAAVEYHEVISLGRRLFWDRRGDTRLYPHSFHESEFSQRTSSSRKADDPDDPAHILIDLESSVTGCRWLLARWAELKDRLSAGLAWDSPDKLKAVRLLGKQPLDAPEDPVVCLIFVASHVVEPRFKNPFHELELEFEFPSDDHRRFMHRLKVRPWKALRPKTGGEARQKLAEVVDKEIARLERIVAGHQRRAELYAEKAALRLAFDASDEAERLRRHERACSRDMFRSLNELVKLRSGGLFSDAEPLHTSLHADQPAAPARSDALPIDPAAPADGFLAGPSITGNGLLASGDESSFQIKANAACTDENETARYADCGDERSAHESVAATLSGMTGIPVHEAPAPALSEPELHSEPPTSPVGEEQPEDALEQADEESVSDPRSTLGGPAPEPAGAAWIACSSPEGMARAACALSKRRKALQLQWKRWRADDRREREKRLQRKLQREQAKREGAPAPLGHAPPVLQESLRPGEV
jgi:hypothetical protein